MTRSASDEWRRTSPALRQVNEAIDRGHAPVGEQITFVCECGRIGCTDTITLSHVTYEQVRTDFKRFLVVPGHQTDVDIVAETHPEHLVVIKSGVAKRVAEDLDPRANESADDQGRN